MTEDSPTEDSSTERRGLVHEYVLRNVATGARTVVSLWDGPVGGHCYEVIEQWAGPAAGQAPGAANLLVFDGPVSPVARQAHERAWTGRLRPAFAELPGTVGNIGLWDPQHRSMVVLLLTTSLADLDAIGQAVSRSELLPDEDPALLPGPDRADIHTVLTGTVTA